MAGSADDSIPVTGTFSRTITVGLSPSCGYAVTNTADGTTRSY